jgi:xanthine dehydrogenase accessory factor
MNLKKETFDNLIILRGGGDLASGVALRLYRSGFDVLILETKNPSFIRRTVSFGQAVYKGIAEVEGVKAHLINEFQYPKNQIHVLIDPEMQVLQKISPLAVVDAVIAKKNLGLSKNLADIVIALGPGFTAETDCHAVIETMRGHNLGRVLYKGEALPDTGTPGIIKGIGKERVIHSPAEGRLKIIKDIGSVVSKGEAIAEVGNLSVQATINGLIRGMIQDDFPVFKGMKIADIDPRLEEKENCYTVSDKARALGGSVLEAILYLRKQNG